MLHIINCDTAHEMWQKLHGVYENKTETSVHMLQQEWFQYTKDPNDDLSTHISKLQDLCCKLKAFGETISDSMLMTKVIMTLPEHYNHFVSAWESTEAAQRTIDNLTARLVMEESRRKTQEKNQDVALLTKKVKKCFPAKNNKSNSENVKNNRTSKYKNVECYNCKRKGHMKKDCWFLEENAHKRPASNSPKGGGAGNNPSGSADDRALICEILLTVTPNINTTAWLLDSGASSHMCGNKMLFSDYINLKGAIPIKLGDGYFVHGIGKGNVEVEAYDGSRWVNKYLKDVLYVPGIKFNLFSMGAALSKNIRCESTNFESTFYKNNMIVALAERSSERDLFTMKFRLPKDIEKRSLVSSSENKNTSFKNKCENVNTKNTNVVTVKECKNVNMLQVWHERLAHQNIEHVRRFLARNGVEVNDSAPFCDACALGKMHRQPFPQSESKTVRVGKLIHADLCGPMEVNSLGNSKYFFLLKDDYSGFVRIYFIKNKSEVKNCFENFILRFENETGKRINILRTDNGLEFINKEMKELTNKYGIKHERTVSYTPEQNGKAERENRTLIEAA